MTTATQKTGRVTNIKDVRGLCEYRFVPKGWVAPLGHLAWFEFDPIKHADEYQKRREDILQGIARLRAFNGSEWNFETTWFKDGEPFYVARVDYHLVERPILVVIGGFV